MQRYTHLLAIALVMFFIGCGQENTLNRHAITGEVSLDGEPLDQGAIRFSPQQKRGTVSSGARIDNGSYEIQTLKGLPAGKYTVRICSTKVEGPPPADPMDDDYRKRTERIPAKYNANSKTIVEVSDDKPNRFDFDILTK